MSWYLRIVLAHPAITVVVGSRDPVLRAASSRGEHSLKRPALVACTLDPYLTDVWYHSLLVLLQYCINCCRPSGPWLVPSLSRSLA